MNAETRAYRPARRVRLRARLSSALGVLAVIAVAGLSAQSASAVKPLKAPRSGPWKVIAAANTPQGLEVKGGVIGSFRVTGHATIADFHLRFTEEGESSRCAGGDGEDGHPKSGTIKFASGASAPIIHVSGAWFVAVDTGTLGGGSLQGAEVNLLSPNGNFPALISVTLETHKGKRSGDVEWDEDTCDVAFVVKPG